MIVEAVEKAPVLKNRDCHLRRCANIAPAMVHVAARLDRPPAPDYPLFDGWHVLAPDERRSHNIGPYDSRAIGGVHCGDASVLARRVGPARRRTESVGDCRAPGGGPALPCHGRRAVDECLSAALHADALPDRRGGARRHAGFSAARIRGRGRIGRPDRPDGGVHDLGAQVFVASPGLLGPHSRGPGLSARGGDAQLRNPAGQHRSRQLGSRNCLRAADLRIERHVGPGPQFRLRILPANHCGWAGRSRGNGAPRSVWAAQPVRPHRDGVRLLPVPASVGSRRPA